MSKELEIKGRVEALRLEPGDMILLSVDQRLSREEAETLKAQARAVFGEWPIAVLDSGLRMAIVHEVTA